MTNDHADAAQAKELVIALHAHLQDMLPRLTHAEREASGDSSRARAMRQTAAELRRDVTQAQFLIERLRRRYPQSQRTPTGDVEHGISPIGTDHGPV